MSTSRDDRDVTRPFDDRTADALLGGRAVEGEPELSAFVADLTALAEAVPTPSSALAALLEGGLVGVAVPAGAAPAVRRRRWATPLWARVVTAGALALAGVLSAAAANALPGGAQNAVADVVGWVTPVHLPHADDESAPLPEPSPSATTAPAVKATPAGTPEPGHHTGAVGGGSGDTTTGGSGGSGSSDAGGSGPEAGGSDDGTTRSSGDGTTGGASVPVGSDERSPSPAPQSDETPTPDPSPTPSDGGSGGSDSG